MECSHFVYAIIARLSGESRRPVPEGEVVTALLAVEGQTYLNPNDPEYTDALRELECLGTIEVKEAEGCVVFRPTQFGILIGVERNIPEDLLPPPPSED